ncbi:OmpA family protein [Sinimarinibacterium sp. CAU 1509]|uniref:OmpA family protein n=1 Tax=Sinimarinibacterium sp. CAU 1509 TaxID=2562283 RepID=UPI0010AD377F|nr:OmpA family protein [Sinimarinibacterium sp. CAU 1509]TJY61015.1 OmpA family protein [Sinimarinibacterium sp. CAU 1509]
MNTNHTFSKRLIAVAAAALLTAACSASLTRPDGADDTRTKLTQLQSDSQLASRAPVEIKDAESAVRAAEKPRADTDLGHHLVLIADRKVDTASATAKARLLEDQRKTLSQQRETARLDSRTREADHARSDATAARADATAARYQTDIARMEANGARQQADELQRQITELNARETDRGLVVTLGDVLFATGRSELRGGTPGDLGKLAAFLNKYPDRSVIIEGHTDSVGSENSNFSLSERRAASVKSYLVGQGVSSSRVTSTGKGEGSPVAGNDSTSGRAQNRRVEVIITNVQTSSK